MNIQIDMDDAIDGWLDAREAWIGGRGRSDLDRLNFATDVLYAAFATDMTPGCRITDIAFHAFHKMLAEEHDKGIPQRMKFHPTPTIVGYA